MDLRDVITAGYVTYLNPPAFQKKFLFNFFLHVFCNSTKTCAKKMMMMMMMMLSNGGDNDKNKDLLPPTRHREVLPDGVRPRLWPC